MFYEFEFFIKINKNGHGNFEKYNKIFLYPNGELNILIEVLLKKYCYKKNNISS